MLSRYNGIGSLKFSIGGSNNQRTSNPCITEVSRLDLQNNRIDMTDSTYREIPSECMPLAKNTDPIRKLSKTNHHGIHDVVKDLKANTPLNLNRKFAKSRQNRNIGATKTAANGNKPKCIPKITSASSICSSSTISNSSLQEYVDNELDTTELAKYMRQINNEIHHDAK